MGFLKTIGKIGGGIGGFAIGGPIGAAIGAGAGGKIGKFASKALLGSDPGAQARGALQEFGLSGRIGGEDVLGGAQKAIVSGFGMQSALARQAAGQSAARSGLAGSSLAQDVQENIGLQSSTQLTDALTNLRLQILNERLRALGIAGTTPRTPGLLESVGGPALSAFLGRPGGGA